MSEPAATSLGNRIARDDEDALEECYRTYGSMVRSYLRRFVRPDEVDDLVQIVFLELWRSRERIDPRRPLEAWIFGIARKRAIDQLRRSSHDVVPVDTLRLLSGPEGEDFAERVAWSAEVRSLLVTLSAEQRRVIELAYYGGLTQAEIATLLEIPLGTVKARMARGMRRLAAGLRRGDETA